MIKLIHERQKTKLYLYTVIGDGEQLTELKVHWLQDLIFWSALASQPRKLNFSIQSYFNPTRKNMNGKTGVT